MPDETVCWTIALLMSHLPPIDAWLRSVAAEAPWLIGLAIIAGTFVHEDITTVVTGMLVADGVVAAVVALPALYVGIVLGDIGLYGMGRLIALNRLSKRLSRKRRFSTLKVWLDERLVAGVFLVRFMPGLRMPAYTTYGFFAMPLGRFVVSVVLAASIWTTGLFLLSWKFAAITAQWLGVLRWPVLIVAIVAPLMIARHLIQDDLAEDETDGGPDSVD